MSTLCSEISAVAGCLTTAAGVKTNLVIHYEYRTAANGNRTLHATRYTDAAGNPVSPAPTDVVEAGQCAVAQPDVEWERLCDKSAAGVVTEFFRRSITSFSAAGVPTVAVTNWQLDKVTAYAPAGTVGACNEDCDVLAPVGVVATWG
jgi:hypothetical protein